MPLNLWSRLKTPDCEVQSFSRWCLSVVSGGWLVLTVVLSHRSIFETSKDVHYALAETMPLRIYTFWSLSVSEQSDRRVEFTSDISTGIHATLVSLSPFGYQGDSAQF